MDQAKRDNVPLAVVYQPKFPLPRECISSVDAAFSMGDKMYLISNTFIWTYQADGLAQVGAPQRLSDVLAGWNYITRAAFTGSYR